MEFKKETLEPLYKLTIGKTGDSNALYISKKMGISDSIIERTRTYIENKDYNYETIKESKKKKFKEVESEEDKVRLLDKNDSAIIYKGRDEFNNVVVLYNKDFIEVNYKRIKLELKAEELYPEGYDLNQLFVSYKDRKLERDIERGSKKALKKLRKEGL